MVLYLRLFGKKIPALYITGLVQPKLSHKTSYIIGEEIMGLKSSNN